MSERAAELTSLILATLALVVVIGDVLRAWRRRVRIWTDSPQRLADPTPPRAAAWTLGLVLAVGAVVLAVPLVDSATSPLALAFSSYAVLAVGHLWRMTAVGGLGLAIAGATWVSISAAWLTRSDAAVTLGLCMAGAHLYWLHRFWQQQLDGDRAWTTTGRLVNTAGVLAGVCLVGLLPSVSLWRWEPEAPAPVWVAGLTAALLLAGFAMLAAETRVRPVKLAPPAGFLVGMTLGNVLYLGFRDAGYLENDQVARWLGVGLGLLALARIWRLGRRAPASAREAS